jgi:hypothetical protein
MNKHEEAARALDHERRILEALEGVEEWMVEWAGYVELVGGDATDHAKSDKVKKVLQAILDAKADDA